MFGDPESVIGSATNTVADVADVQVGLVIKPTRFYSADGTGTPAFRSLNIGEMYIRDSEWVYFTDKGMEENQRTIAHTGDVLVVRSGYPGTSCVVTPEYDGRNVVDLIIAHPNVSKILPEFLCAFTNYPHGKIQIENTQRGVAQKHFNVSLYNKMKIVVPPMELQKQFVQMLHQSDKSKFVRFKSQFIEMFGDPATNSKNLPIATLQDLGTNLDNRRIPITGGDRKAGEYPYYGASGIVDYVADYIFDDDLLLISEDGANLVARVTPIAFPSTGKVWINNHAHVIKFNSMAMQCYVENLLNMMDISPYVTGTAQPKLNQSKLNSIPIPVPEEDQIREYLEFVKQSDKSK